MSGSPQYLGLVLLGFLASSSASGCHAGSPPPAEAVYVVCDNTGESEEDTCSSSFLKRLGEDWSERCKMQPASLFQVICTAGTYGSTREQEPIIVPRQWDGNARLARFQWQKDDVVAVLGGVEVPHDTPLDWWINKSDYVSAITLASMLAGERPEHHRRLLVAGDGLWVGTAGGHTFSLETRVPPVEEVIERLEWEGMAWDLSMFESIEFCGQHHGGLSAGRDQARRTSHSFRIHATA